MCIGYPVGHVILHFESGAIDLTGKGLIPGTGPSIWENIRGRPTSGRSNSHSPVFAAYCPSSLRLHRHIANFVRPVKRKRRQQWKHNLDCDL